MKKLSPELQIIALEITKIGSMLEIIAAGLKLLNEGLENLDKVSDDGIRIPEKTNP